MVTNSGSSGIAPTGTYTIYDGGSAVVGTITYFVGQAASSAGNASVQASFTFSFTAPGSHSLTAKYSGDSNYASSVSAVPFSVSVNSPTTTTLNSSSSNIILGNSVTLTAVVDTAYKSPFPAHNVVFYGTSEGNFPGTITYTNITDSSGNAALQASLVVTPSSNEAIFATFNGDTNYASSGSNPLDLTIITPDFTLGPSAPTINVTAGQTGTAQLTITPLTTYTSSVTMSCPGGGTLPIGSTCAFSSNPVALSSSAAALTTLSVSTLAPSLAAAFLPAKEFFVSRLAPGGGWWLLSAAAGMAAFVLLLPGCRQYRPAFSLSIVCVVSFAVGCGTTSGSSGGGPQLAATTITLTGTTPKVAAQSSVQFTATVTSTAGAPVTGYVNFYDNLGFGQFVNLTNGQAQVQTVLSGVGTHRVFAAYSGDTNNQGSTSAAFNQVITGTTTIYVTAQTGTNSHQIPVVITVQ